MRPVTLTSTALLLCAFLSAQAGSYTVYGSGCNGTGDILKGPNGNGSATVPWRISHNSNVFGLQGTTTKTEVVLGMELLNGSRTTTPVTIAIQLYLADSTGTPQSKPTTTGTMTIGLKDGWYRGVFQQPQVLKANTRFFLSYTPTANMKWSYIYPPTSGTLMPHWELKTNGWVGPFTQVPWCWRLVCSSGLVVPQTGNTGVPKINTSFSIDVTKARPDSTTILVLGQSNSVWNTTKLPLDLTPYGAAGCRLLASQDFLLFTKTNAAGNASIKVPIPNDRTLIGATAFNQWAVDDPGANAWGLAFSAGGAIKVGG
ncbi:MAG: hypothetical protein ACYTGW_15935 [Planctomycetota bacterium]